MTGRRERDLSHLGRDGEMGVGREREEQAWKEDLRDVHVPSHTSNGDITANTDG